MKTALAAGSVIAFVILVGCGGGGSHHRSDWRRARPCATDDDCNGGKCVLGEGETQAACSGGSLPPLPPSNGTDGGTRAPGPAPSIQPAPGDIQI
jgi:hypothetical protein